MITLKRGGTSSCYPARIIAEDPIKDICILSTAVRAKPAVIVGTDALMVGEEVEVHGFPHLAAKHMMLTYQHADIGARIMLGPDGAKFKAIVLNTLHRPGQSGSPVFMLGSANLVAIAIGAHRPHTGGGIVIITPNQPQGLDPHAIHQTTYAVSAEYLGGMIP